MVLVSGGGEAVLHTGDFRLDDDALSLAMLELRLAPPLDRSRLSVHFDATCLCWKAVAAHGRAPSWPSELESIAQVVQHVIEETRTSRPLICFFSYAGVRASVMMARACAQQLGCTVFVTESQRTHIGDLLREAGASRIFSSTACGARCVVLSAMPSLQKSGEVVAVLSRAVEEAGGHESFDRGILCYASGNLAQSDPLNYPARTQRIDMAAGRAIVQCVPYMHHSTYDELVAFFRSVRPGGRVVATLETRGREDDELIRALRTHAGLT